MSRIMLALLLLCSIAALPVSAQGQRSPIEEVRREIGALANRVQRLELLDTPWLSCDRRPDFGCLVFAPAFRSQRFGRFHQPGSAWNNELHHGHYLQTAITRPAIEAWEDEEGLIPQHLVGTLLESRRPSSFSTLP